MSVTKHSDQKLWEAFKDADLDDSGYIAKSELKTLFEKMGDSPSQAEYTAKVKYYFICCSC